MTLNEIEPENEPTGPRRTPTDRAVAAVERMMDASSRVGNAYADAYQEAVINLADFRGKLGDRGAPRDRLKLVPRPADAGADPPRQPLHDATEAVGRVNEQLLAASRQLSLAYVDAYEQAVHGNPNASADSMRHNIGCEVTRAYVDAARRMLS
jgi:hypothetical protein